jgi:hypothetical protein
MKRETSECCLELAVKLGMCQQLCGLVQRVDVINRELEVQLPAQSLLFDVPIDCLVMLHGERIKLRMVQSGDQVAVTFSRRAESLHARRLVVQPSLP